MWALPITLIIIAQALIPHRRPKRRSPIELTRNRNHLCHRSATSWKQRESNATRNWGLITTPVTATCYDWELYFDAILLAYFGGEDYAIQGLQSFWPNNRRTALFRAAFPNIGPPRTWPQLTNPLYAEEKKEHCKPFLFQIALIVSRTRTSTHWMAPEDYPPIRLPNALVERMGSRPERPL